MGVNSTNKPSSFMISCMSCHHVYESVIPFCARCGTNNTSAQDEEKKFLRYYAETLNTNKNHIVQMYNHESNDLLNQQTKEKQIFWSWKRLKNNIITVCILSVCFILIWVIPGLSRYYIVIMLAIFLLVLPFLTYQKKNQSIFSTSFHDEEQNFD